MPNFDFECPLCADIQEHLVRNKKEWPYHCGTRMKKVWVTAPPNVIQDSFEGGRWVENLDVNPVKVYSKTELKREMDARGLQEAVRHTPVPGTDRSPQTTSWASISKETLDGAKSMLEAHASKSVRSTDDMQGVVGWEKESKGFDAYVNNLPRKILDE